MKITQSFRDKASETRRIFGTEGNSITKIVNRALRSFKSQPFDYSEPKDKLLKNPVTIRHNSDFENAKIMGITIAYCNIQIEKTMSRRQPAAVLDETVNFRVEE